MSPTRASAETYTYDYLRAVDPGDLDVIAHLSAGRGRQPEVEGGRFVTPLYYGSVRTICRYQAVQQPENHNPLVDLFVGCDYVDAYDLYGGRDWVGQSMTVGAHIGQPNQKAPACEGAQLTVNDSFMSQNGPAANLNLDITVQDVNVVWDDGVIVGYEYLGSDRNKYIQVNTGTGLGVSFGISVGFVGLTGCGKTGFRLASRPWLKYNDGKSPRFY